VNEGTDVDRREKDEWIVRECEMGRSEVGSRDGGFARGVLRAGLCGSGRSEKWM
jgi:hypothetical protein